MLKITKILYLSANGFPESTSDPRGSFSLEHASALRAEGVQVISVDMRSADFGSDLLSKVEILRAPRFRSIVKSLSARKLAEYVRFYRGLHRLDYDCVVFSFFLLKYIPFVWFFKKKEVPIVMIAHGGEVMPGSLLRKSLKRYLFNNVDLVTPVSDYTTTLFSCLIGRRNDDSRKIRTIFNGIDMTKLRMRSTGKRLRVRINATDEDFIVLSVSNLVERKGVDLIVRAVDELLQDGRKIKHVIVGNGPEESSLKALAAKNGNRNEFHFLPNVEQSELSECYKSSDVFALMSRTDWNKGQTEGFGIVYAEAMAVGTPVIGGGESGTTTPIKDGFTGVVIDPHSSKVVSMVKNEILRFMDEPEYRKAMSANALWYARKEFSWRQNARKTLFEIESLKTSGRVETDESHGACRTHKM